jgi:hypothetical protein
MFRKIVSSIILASFVSLLYTSCQEHSPIEPDDTDKTIFENPDVTQFQVNNPGMLHNDVLAEFNKHHNLLSNKKMSIHRYAQLLSKSINSVFRKNDIPFQTTRSDILRTIRDLSKHGARGEYDFFSTEHDLPYEMFEYLKEEYGAKPEVLDQYMNIMISIRQNEQSPAKRDPRLRSFYTLNTGNSDKDEFIIDIARGSYEFWTTLVNLDETELTDITWDDWEEIKKKYFAFEPDLAAAILCIIVPSIPSLIALLYSLAASTAFSLADSCWSEYDHYHTR